jgi:glycosyltransferase involved in cell wall biosynthesis
VDDEYFLMYGAVRDRIVRYPFTSLYEKDLLIEAPTQQRKAEIKKALGIKEEKMILLVGRFIFVKGYDVMLNACKNIDKNTAVYFVGGTPTQEYLQLKEELGLSHVYFVDFMSKQELESYYIASDLFVLPTRGDTWGLVINEAMAYGLPVITTHMCIAGLALVENNANGFLVPVDDVEALTDRIHEILTHDELRDKMAHRSLEKIQRYTYENMAKRHIEILNNMNTKGWELHEK